MDSYLDAEQLMKIGMRGFKEAVEYNWHGMVITIRTMLSLEEEADLVEAILDCCMDEDGEHVIAERIDFAVRAGIVASYACVELPESVDDQHVLLYYSDLYDVVLKCANRSQVENIVWSVRQYVGV